jgi:LmbE family N-acetylglucosaminyl deacetylase
MRTTDPRATVADLGDIVTVWAHPDDESYLAAGLMAMAVDAGSRVTCVTATAGERGGPADLEAELSWLRPEELRQALAALGVDDSVLLGHPDGGCAWADRSAAADQLSAVLRDRRPDTIVTFGPDGLTGHPDHQAVSWWVDLAVDRLDGERPRVLHAAETAAAMAVLDAAPAEARVGLSGIAPEVPELAVELVLPPDVLDRKVAALRSHRTQTAALEARFGVDLYRSWVATEGFVLARVPAGAAA